MKKFLSIIDSGKSLTEDEMIEAMTLIMNGEVADDDLTAFLTRLAQRGETVEEITGAARVLRVKANTLKAPFGAVDCCGTGGDKSGTYNISTAVALVAAACGVPVAKHGNRASSSKSGAADVLEALGANLEMTRENLEDALRTIHFAFLMAPHHHQAMKHVAAVRKQIGTRTIFNILGPLANPAATKYQLIGVFDQKWLVPMAQTLKKLGTKRAWVVHGSDGLDEITVTGPTYAAILNDGEITTREISPEDFGLETSAPEKLLGGNAEQNALALRALLEGQEGAYRDIVLANAAAVLCIHGKAKHLKSGTVKAAEAIDSGLALQTLHDYIAFSRAVQN